MPPISSTTFAQTITREITEALQRADADGDGTVTRQEHARFAREDQQPTYADDFARYAPFGEAPFVVATVSATMRRDIPRQIRQRTSPNGTLSLQAARAMHFEAEYRRAAGLPAIPETTVAFVTAAQDSLNLSLISGPANGARRISVSQLPPSLRAVAAQEARWHEITQVYAITVGNRRAFALRFPDGQVNLYSERQGFITAGIIKDIVIEWYGL